MKTAEIFCLRFSCTHDHTVQSRIWVTKIRAASRKFDSTGRSSQGLRLRFSGFGIVYVKQMISRTISWSRRVGARENCCNVTGKFVPSYSPLLIRLVGHAGLRHMLRWRLRHVDLRRVHLMHCVGMKHFLSIINCSGCVKTAEKILIRISISFVSF